MATALPGLDTDRVKVFNRETPAGPVAVEYDGANFELRDGSVCVAAITSCTNTSNPGVMIAAGLVARKAAALGLKAKPWVKTSLAPGSTVVTEYLEKSDLMKDFNAVGYWLVGYGCTTCIGNTGPLPPPISAAINENNLICLTLSGFLRDGLVARRGRCLVITDARRLSALVGADTGRGR